MAGKIFPEGVLKDQHSGQSQANAQGEGLGADWASDEASQPEASEFTN